MATLKSEFQDLAAELIDDEFADFRRNLDFFITNDGGYDPITEQSIGGTTVSYSYKAIPQPVDMREWQNTDIQVTDIAVVYTRIDSFTPSVADKCTFSAKQMQVKAVMLDAADATVKLVLRAL